MKITRHGFYLLIMVLFASALLSFGYQDQLVPDVVVSSTEGVKMGFRDGLKPGKTNVVVVWKGCCTDGLTLLEELNDLIGDDTTSLALVAVSCDNSRNSRKVAGQVRATGYEGWILLDENQDLSRALGLQVFPTVMLVSSNRIVWRASGYSPGMIDEIEKQIRVRGL